MSERNFKAGDRVAIKDDCDVYRYTTPGSYGTIRGAAPFYGEHAYDVSFECVKNPHPHGATDFFVDVENLELLE